MRWAFLRGRCLAHFALKQKRKKGRLLEYERGMVGPHYPQEPSSLKVQKMIYSSSFLLDLNKKSCSYCVRSAPSLGSTTHKNGDLVKGGKFASPHGSI